MYTHTHTHLHMLKTEPAHHTHTLFLSSISSSPSLLSLSPNTYTHTHTHIQTHTHRLDKTELLEKLKRAQKAYSKKGVGTFCPLFVTHTHTDTDTDTHTHTKEGGEGKMPRRLWARIVEVALERAQAHTHTHTQGQGGEGGGGGGGKSVNMNVNTPTPTHTHTPKGVTTWGSLSPKALLALAEEIKGSVYETTGKGTFKEEFVTCGGVSLKEVDFRTW